MTIRSIYKQQSAKLVLKKHRVECAKGARAEALVAPAKADQRALAEAALNEWKSRVPVHQGRNLSDLRRKY